jgi:O-antigen/teichoic acid export membrane protein
MVSDKMLQAKAARGVKWQMIEIAGRHVVSLFVFTALARLLDPPSFGLVALVALYLSIASILNEQGLVTALIQRSRLEREHLNSAFWFKCFSACVLCAVTIIFAGPLAALFKEPRIAPLLRWASLTLVIDATARVHAALFMKNLDLRRPALRTLLANLIGGIVGVVMALSGCGVWALVGQQLAASITGATFLWLASDWRPQMQFSWPHLKELMGMGTAISVTALIRVVSGGADRFCIARYLGSGVLGHYAIAGKFVELICSALYQPAMAVAQPALAMLQHDRPRYMNALYKAMSLNAIVTFPVLIGLAVVARDAIPLLFGAKWQEAAPILQLMTIYVLTQGVQVFFQSMLLAVDKPAALLTLNVMTAAGGVVACVIGVQYGIRGILFGLTVNSILMGGITFVYLASRLRLSIAAFWKPCLWPAVAVLCMVAATYFVRAELWAAASSVRLIAQIASGAAVYCGIVTLFARDDVALMLGFVRSAVYRSNISRPSVAVAA